MPSSRAVRIEKARTLLRPGIPGPGGLWADLGCGDGIFTAALHSLIQPGGAVYAVDKSRGVLDRLARNLGHDAPDALVRPVQADFTRPLSLPALDGVVMANALHFVRQKVPVVRQIAGFLKPGGRIIVIEYNTSRGNSWVPHPLDEDGFLALAREVGLRDPRILIKIPSTFSGEMYSGMGVRGA
jgi:SAM-dependent methyltransferase